MGKNKLFSGFLFLFGFFYIIPLKAQLNPVIDSIPMGDGKKLAADIYIPAGMSTGPVILIQTPYNRQLYKLRGLPLGIKYDQKNSPYIFVITDWRGFYGSSKSRYIGSPSNGEDGYSIVEWIAKQSWSNQKIGTWGPSALGKIQFQTAKENPPHLTCICPLVAGPQFNYDEYYANGCLRTAYIEQLDALGFGISNTIITHPYYDATWTFVEKLNLYPESIQVPTLMIGGWYDHNVKVMLDFYDTLRKVSPTAVRDQHKLLMGPWVHGGRGNAQVGTVVQGELSYPNASGLNDTFALQFFDYHLRSKNNSWDKTPFITYYQMGENNWKESPIWPPNSVKYQNLFLHGDGSMITSSPVVLKDSLSYMYNPRDPSPTIGGPTLNKDLSQGPFDISTTVESRNDLIRFSTETLAQDLTIVGSIIIKLKVSSDKPDTDFAIRLTDVYPDGKSIIFADGIRRMRFRLGNKESETLNMVPGKVYDCEIEVPNTAITIKPGHKLRLDVSSSNYPQFNRNMNTGLDMYPGNSLDSLVNPVNAFNSIHVSAQNASFISLPILGKVNGIKTQLNFQRNLTISPNPASRYVKIEWLNSESTKQWNLINNLGQEISNNKASHSMDQIEIENLPDGIYYLKVISNKGVYHQKFIIKH